MGEVDEETAAASEKKKTVVKSIQAVPIRSGNVCPRTYFFLYIYIYIHFVFVSLDYNSVYIIFYRSGSAPNQRGYYFSPYARVLLTACRVPDSPLSDSGARDKVPPIPRSRPGPDLRESRKSSARALVGRTDVVTDTGVRTVR